MHSVLLAIWRNQEVPKFAINAIVERIFIIFGFWYFRFGPDFPVIIINSLPNKWLTIAIIIECSVVKKLYTLALILLYLGLNFGD
jgi:hypothetical protein